MRHAERASITIRASEGSCGSMMLLLIATSHSPAPNAYHTARRVIRHDFHNSHTWAYPHPPRAEPAQQPPRLAYAPRWGCIRPVLLAIREDVAPVQGICKASASLLSCCGNGALCILVRLKSLLSRFMRRTRAAHEALCIALLNKRRCEALEPIVCCFWTLILRPLSDSQPRRTSHPCGDARSSEHPSLRPFSTPAVLAFHAWFFYRYVWSSLVAVVMVTLDLFAPFHGCIMLMQV